MNTAMNRYIDRRLTSCIQTTNEKSGPIKFQVKIYRPSRCYLSLFLFTTLTNGHNSVGPSAERCPPTSKDLIMTLKFSIMSLNLLSKIYYGCFYIEKQCRLVDMVSRPSSGKSDRNSSCKRTLAF